MDRVTVHFRWTALCAGVLILLAVGLRFLLISHNWPSSNSDEGTMGLMTLHIAYRGRYPLIFYGQGYIGTLEAYIGALLFHLLGPSEFSLRIGVLALFGLFLLVMYYLTSLLFSKRLALFTLLLLALGSRDMVYQQVIATGGHPETPLFAAVILLLASWLALSAVQNTIGSPGKRRMLVYGIWGVVSGLAIWNDPLVLPFVVMGGLLLFKRCHTELQKSVLWCLTGGLLLGLLPLIIYTASVSIIQSPLAVFSLLVWHGQTSSPPSPLQNILGMLVVTLPAATGANALCPLPTGDNSPLAAVSSPNGLFCMSVHTAWGLSFLLLWVMAFRQARSAYRQSATKDPSGVGEQRRRTTLQFARLMLLSSTGLTLLLYLLSPQPALNPGTTARYLVGLLVALPAMLWPLWNRSADAQRFQPLLAVGTTVGRYTIFGLITITLLVGMIGTLQMIPKAQAHTQQQYKLVHDLLQVGVTRFYTDYWTCDLVIFQSQERIICSVLDEKLQPGFDRYLPYRAIVRNDSQAAYVFPTGSTFAKAVAQKMSHTNARYRQFTIDGYVIYQPLL